MFLGGGVNVRESGEGGVDALHCLLPALPLAQALGGAQAVGSRLKIFDGFRNKYSLLDLYMYRFSNRSVNV